MKQCKIVGCGNDVSLIYYKYGVCEKHWQLHCDDKKRFEFDSIGC